MKQHEREIDILCSIIGEELCLKVMQQLGGARFYVPLDFTSRNRDIVAKFKAGMTANQLAIEYKVTFAYVENLVRADAKG